MFLETWDSRKGEKSNCKNHFLTRYLISWGFQALKPKSGKKTKNKELKKNKKRRKTGKTIKKKWQKNYTHEYERKAGKFILNGYIFIYIFNLNFHSLSMFSFLWSLCMKKNISTGCDV